MRSWNIGLALPVVLTLLCVLTCSVAGMAKGPAEKSGTKSTSGTTAPANESPGAAVARGKKLMQNSQYDLAIAAFTGALNKDDKLRHAYLMR
jgi:hypothetical protein